MILAPTHQLCMNFSIYFAVSHETPAEMMLLFDESMLCNYYLPLPVLLFFLTFTHDSHLQQVMIVFVDLTIAQFR
jgi:hypothetical protein